MSGWGATNAEGTEGSPVLKDLEVTVLSNEHCLEKYRDWVDDAGSVGAYNQTVVNMLKSIPQLPRCVSFLNVINIHNNINTVVMPFIKLYFYFPVSFCVYMAMQLLIQAWHARAILAGLWWCEKMKGYNVYNVNSDYSNNCVQEYLNWCY